VSRLQFEYWKEFGDFLERRGSFIHPSAPFPRVLTTLVLRHPCFQLAPGMSIPDKRISISLTISDAEANLYFKSTHIEKARIERELGTAICWTDCAGEQVSRIFLYYDKNVDPLDRRDWASQHAWLCKKLEVIYQIFAPRQQDSSTRTVATMNRQPAAPTLLTNSGNHNGTQIRPRITSSIKRSAVLARVLSAVERITTRQIAAPALARKKPPAAYISGDTTSPLNYQTLKVPAGNNSAAVTQCQQITNRSLWMIGGLIALLIITIPIVKHSFAKPVNIYNPPKNVDFNIVLKTTTGEPFALSSLRGRVVLLNVWSTWCIPCRKEIPVLNALQNDYEAKGLTVVGISWDDTSDDIKRFQKEKLAQNYSILLQGKSLQSNFGGLNGLPATYLIDRQGQIRHVLLGTNDRATLEGAVRSLVDTP